MIDIIIRLNDDRDAVDLDELAPALRAVLDEQRYCVATIGFRENFDVDDGERAAEDPREPDRLRRRAMVESRKVYIEEQLNRQVSGQWTYNDELSLALIDSEESVLRRAGGPREPDEKAVARFQRDMESGDTFPPIIVIDPAHGGKLVVLHGLRIYLAARLAGRVTISAYLVPEGAADRLV